MAHLLSYDTIWESKLLLKGGNSKELVDSGVGRFQEITSSIMALGYTSSHDLHHRR